MRWSTVWWLVWKPPGSWLLIASLCGWALLEVLSNVGGRHPMMAGTMPATHSYHELLLWLAMLLAMAPLVLRREVALVWRTNLRRRRRAALISFLLAYSAPWLLLGLALPPLVELARSVMAALIAGAALTFAWQCSPLHKRLLIICHRRPRLRVFGFGMIVDTARFGLRTGGCCCALCGPAMIFAMAATTYHIAAMGVVAAVATVERYAPVGRAAWSLPLTRREPRWRSFAVVPPPGIIPV